MMFAAKPQHLAKLKECFSQAPTQLAVGDAPQAYIRRLEEITGKQLKCPSPLAADSLSREDVHRLCQKGSTNELLCYASVMAWGGRGQDSRNYRLSLESPSLENLIKAIDTVRASAKSRQADFAAFQTAASNIKGLGISFYTKLLFFLRPKRKDDKPAYILDQFTAKSAKLLFPECPLGLTSGGYPDPNTLPKHYEWFCTALEHLGNEIDPDDPWSGEEVEMALFDKRGGDWRKYVRSHFGVQRPKRKRQNSSGSKVSPALESSRSLAEVVAAEHVRAYSDGVELPPLHGSVTAQAKVNCGMMNGLNWQYVVTGKEVRAAVFVPSSERHRYDALREHLGVTGHSFGGRIEGTGFKDGKTCTICNMVSMGSSESSSVWPTIADNAIAAMNELFTTVAEVI